MFKKRKWPIHIFFVKILRCYDLSFAADAGNNACGLGFNGYDSNGRELWNRFTNVNALEIEVSVGYLSFLLRITISNEKKKRTLMRKAQKAILL